jgi:hypothetical protein
MSLVIERLLKAFWFVSRMEIAQLFWLMREDFCLKEKFGRWDKGYNK